MLAANLYLADSFFVRLVDTHFHQARQRLSATLRLVILMVNIRYQRSAFSHAIAHHIRESYPFQEQIHFRIQRSTSDNHFLYTAAECVHQSLTQLPENNFVQQRHFHHPTYRRFRDLRSNLILVNLLQYQRNCQYHRRFHFLKRLQQNLRRRNPAHQPAVTTCAETAQEVKRAAKRVSQRQEHYLSATAESHAHIYTELHISSQRVQRSDNTLRKARRSARVVVRRNLAVSFVRINQIQLLQSVRMNPVVFLLNPFGRYPVCFQAFLHSQRLKIRQREYRRHLLHLTDIHRLVQSVCDKQQP